MYEDLKTEFNGYYENIKFYIERYCRENNLSNITICLKTFLIEYAKKEDEIKINNSIYHIINNKEINY